MRACHPSGVRLQPRISRPRSASTAAIWATSASVGFASTIAGQVLERRALVLRVAFLGVQLDQLLGRSLATAGVPDVRVTKTAWLRESLGLVEPLAHCRERARASPVRDAPLPPARCASQVAGHRARKGKVDAGDGAGHDTIRSILGHRTPSTWPTGRRRSWPLPAMTVAPAGATGRIGLAFSRSVSTRAPGSNGSCSADGHRATLNPARLVTGVPQVRSPASRSNLQADRAGARAELQRRAVRLAIPTQSGTTGRGGKWWSLRGPHSLRPSRPNAPSALPTCQRAEPAPPATESGSAAWSVTRGPAA